MYACSGCPQRTCMTILTDPLLVRGLKSGKIKDVIVIIECTAVYNYSKDHITNTLPKHTLSSLNCIIVFNYSIIVYVQVFLSMITREIINYEKALIHLEISYIFSVFCI